LIWTGLAWTKAGYDLAWTRAGYGLIWTWDGFKHWIMWVEMLLGGEGGTGTDASP